MDLDADRHVRVDPALVRSAERTASVGDPRKAHEKLESGTMIGKLVLKGW